MGESEKQHVAKVPSNAPHEEAPPANLYLYNVGNEASLEFLNAGSYTPDSTVRQMRRDLAALPAWTAENVLRDAVLVPSEHSLQLPFPEELAPPAQLLTEQMMAKEAINRTFKLKINGFEPTLVRELIKRHKKEGVEGILYPQNFWGTTLYSSEEAAFLRKLHDRSLCCDFLLRYFPHLSPYQVGSKEQLIAFTKQVTSNSVVLKQPFSSSGRGVFAQTKAQILENKLSFSLKFPYTAEPLYNNLSDWASEFAIDSDKKVQFLGLSHFQTEGFRYIHNIISAPETLWGILSSAVGEKSLDEIIALQKQFLEERVAPHYVGDVGVDMFVYHDDTGKLALHPCCEVNVRTTMGHFALRLFNRYGVVGNRYHFAIKYFPYNSGAILWRERELASAPPIAGKEGRLAQGTLLLSGIESNTCFVAFLSCEKAVAR